MKDIFPFLPKAIVTNPSVSDQTMALMILTGMKSTFPLMENNWLFSP